MSDYAPSLACAAHMVLCMLSLPVIVMWRVGAAAYVELGL